MISRDWDLEKTRREGKLYNGKQQVCAASVYTVVVEVRYGNWQLVNEAIENSDSAEGEAVQHEIDNIVASRWDQEQQQQMYRSAHRAFGCI